MQTICAPSNLLCHAQSLFGQFQLSHFAPAGIVLGSFILAAFLAYLITSPRA